ncbi:hypothetical protein HY572_00935 [Candidatus Micrarchaeota archaeon]|nr:hypothetical protein [Candidatus Micrarchaeota archaeon]
MRLKNIPLKPQGVLGSLSPEALELANAVKWEVVATNPDGTVDVEVTVKSSYMDANALAERLRKMGFGV